MRWSREGIIFPYTSDLSGTKSHCQYPCPVLLNNDLYRIYFGSRDKDNNTIIFSFDYDIETREIKDVCYKPILLNGPIGHFDANGIYPSCVIKRNNEYFMYTLGFMRGESPLYYTRIGLAVSKDGKNYDKYSPAPLLNTSRYDPWMLTGPFVMFDNGRYRMWYVSGDKWDEEMNSYYHIKYAESKDGINWKRDGLVSIDYAYEDEKNIARPWVIKEEGIYKAWFSYSCVDKGYRIGYAESTDEGFTFKRMDKVGGLDVSNEEWENQAVAYPAVIRHRGKKYMFYNGNRFGADGICMAEEIFP